jgi:hypothetical protein
MTLYVDGVEIGKVPMTGAIRVDNNPITVGAEENDSVPHVVVGEFAGSIDEVRIDDRALSARGIGIVFRGGSST